MAKSRAEKEKLLEKYRELLSNNAGFIAVDPKGSSTTLLTDLKKKLRELNAKLVIVKNNVFKIALEETNQPLDSKDFDNQTAVITFENDPTAPAKLIKEIRQDKEKQDLLTPRYSLVEGNYYDGEKTMALADIPSRPELLAKLLGSLNAPLTGFASVVTGNARGFVQVVRQLSERESK